MHFPISLTALLLLLTPALAAPLSLPPPNLLLRSNASLCSGYTNAFFHPNQSAFSITLGSPYLNDGTKCDIFKDKIAQSFVVKGFKCQGSNNGQNTVLKITSNMDATNLANVNRALRNAFPEIQFNCPTALRK